MGLGNTIQAFVPIIQQKFQPQVLPKAKQATFQTLQQIALLTTPILFHDQSTVASLTVSTTIALQSINLTNEPICLLKTAVATVTNESTRVHSNILSDKGSQHSLVLIDKLQLQPHQTEAVQLSTFGSTNPQVKKLNVTTLQVITTTGTPISVNVLIVPIATLLENTLETSILTDLPHLRDFSQ